MWSKTTALAGCLSAVLAASAVNAAEVNVIASTAMREVLGELVPMFERASGHKVTVSFLSGAVLPGKVKEGAEADLVVTTPATIDDLVKAGKLVAGTPRRFRPLGRRRGGTGGRAQARHQHARSVQECAPCRQVGRLQPGPERRAFHDRAGAPRHCRQIKAKGVVASFGQRVGGLIAKGDAEIGVQQITELLKIPASISSDRCRRSCRRTSSIRPRRPSPPRSAPARPRW